MPTAPPHLLPPKGGAAGAAVRQLSCRTLPRLTLQGAAALKSLMFLDLSAQARDQGAASLSGVRRIVSAGAALGRCRDTLEAFENILCEAPAAPAQRVGRTGGQCHSAYLCCSVSPLLLALAAVDDGSARIDTSALPLGKPTLARAPHPAIQLLPACQLSPLAWTSSRIGGCQRCANALNR